MSRRPTSFFSFLGLACLVTVLAFGRKANSVPVPKEKSCADCKTCFNWIMYRYTVSDDTNYYRYVKYQGNIPVPVENSHRWSAPEYWLDPRKCVGGTPDGILPDPEYYEQKWTSGTVKCDLNHNGKPTQVTSVGGDLIEEYVTFASECVQESQ